MRKSAILPVAVVIHWKLFKQIFFFLFEMKAENWFSLVKGIIELFTRLEKIGKRQIPNHNVFAFGLEIHKRIM